VADQDDLLSADEIEALIQAARTDAPDASLGNASASANELLDPREIEALMQGNVPPARPAPPLTSPLSGAESTLRQAEANLAAALSKNAPQAIPPELGTPTPFHFQDLNSIAPRASDPLPLTALQDVELDLRIELGRTELLIDEVLRLREGSVVPLDKLAGDPVDILVNGRLVARGEVLVLNDNFCVRVAEILTPEA
jgi:flagellar motor switch protein FliN/FliY